MDTQTSSTTGQTNPKPPDVVVRGNAHGFLQQIVAGSHRFSADEPVSAGGGNSAPDPYDYVLAGLGACTSMMVGLHARQNRLPLENITVSLRHSRIHARDCAECVTKEGMLDRIEVDVELTGLIDAGATRKADGGRQEMPCPSRLHIRDQHQTASCAVDLKVVSHTP